MKTMIRLALALTAIALAPAALAQTSPQTASLPVQVVVNTSCRLQSVPLLFDFGTYDPLAATAAAPVHQTFQVRCNKNTAATVSIGNGTHLGTVAAPYAADRAMAAGAAPNTEYLAYRLYSDNASPATAWGSITQTAVSASTPMTFDIYGVIPAGQDVTAQTYTDTVVISVTF